MRRTADWWPAVARQKRKRRAGAPEAPTAAHARAAADARTAPAGEAAGYALPIRRPLSIQRRAALIGVQAQALQRWLRKLQ